MTVQPSDASFSGATRYVLDEELAQIVNISMALEMPLLLKGEPGTGKTMLAHAIAESLNMPLIVLNVKSSMKLVEALYQYDTLTRLNDSRFGDSRRDVSNIEEYIKMGKIGQAFVADKRTVLLIDEIDKADTDFQDDMLDVLDQMEFDIIEIDKTVSARHRPVIIITSNAKKDLSDPFLGRCNFHHIAFPDPKMMRGSSVCISPDPRRPGGQRHCRLLPHAGVGRVEKTGHPGTDQLDPRPERRSGFQAQTAAKGDVPFLGVLFKKSGLRLPAGQCLCQPAKDVLTMFLAFFYKLKEMGVPVSPTAFLTLHRALANRLVPRWTSSTPLHGPSW
jgi:nucleoside-triphosphatase THEP1